MPVVLSFSEDRVHVDDRAAVGARIGDKPMTARTAKTAKRTAAKAKPAAKTKIARKRPAKPQARPVAALEAKAGAKVPSPKVARAIALARRPEGATPQEIMDSQGWTPAPRNVTCENGVNSMATRCAPCALTFAFAFTWRPPPERCPILDSFCTILDSAARVRPGGFFVAVNERAEAQ
jgi:hypothetical protein